MRKPDFFIVGAPKCGTTALYTYLSQHPDIFMSEQKEPFFFGTDFKFRYPYWWIRDEEKYLALFEDAGNAKRAGEATVWYLATQRAAQEIYDFQPTAKIIIMLRNPIDMMYSWHSQMLWATYEDITNFSQALDAEFDRREGRRVPDGACVAEGLLYRQMATYSVQVQRFMDVFPREQLQVLIFDDFKKDVASVYKRTLEFLEVDSSFQTEFARINENKRARSRTLSVILRRPSPQIRSVVRALMPAPLRGQLYKTLTTANMKKQEREPLDPQLRARLQNEFRPEIERLSQLLNRDLTHWCKADK
jgi:hypothetical protein